MSASPAGSEADTNTLPASRGEALLLLLDAWQPDAQAAPLLQPLLQVEAAAAHGGPCFLTCDAMEAPSTTYNNSLNKQFP